MLKYTFILFLVFHFNAYGEIVSEALYPGKKPDSLQVIHPGHLEHSGLIDSALHSKSVLISKADSLRALGTQQLQQGNHQLALYYYENSYQSALNGGYPKGMFSALNNMGATYRLIDEYELALEKLFEALELSKQYPLEYDKGMVLSNIGRTYFKLQNLNRAITYIQESIAVSEAQHNAKGRHFAMLNLVRIYRDSGLTEKALEIVDRLIVMTDPENKGHLGGALLEKGVIFLAQKKYEQARESLEQSLILFQQKGFQLPLARVYINLAKVEFYQDHWPEAHNDLQQAKKIVSANENSEVLMEYYQLSSQLYEKEKKYKQALHAQRLYDQYKEKIFNKKKALKIDSLHVKLLSEKNDKLLSLKEKEIASKRNIISLLVIITILGVLVTILLFNFYRVNRRTAKQLTSKNKEIDEHKKALEKTNQQLETQVTQRTLKLKKVNKELNTLLYKSSHDLRSPTTTILGLAQLAKLDTKETLAADYFQMIADTARLNLKVLEKLFKATEIFNMELTPERIDFGQLIQEVLQNLENMESFERLKVDIQVEEGLEFYSDKKLLSILFEQLLQNAVYFHDPVKLNNQLKIEIAKKNRSLNIVVKDNGMGIPLAFHDKVFDMFFKAHTASSGHGIGLYIVSKAIEALGAEIDMQSKEHEGTSFWISIPVRA